MCGTRGTDSHSARLEDSKSSTILIFIYYTGQAECAAQILILLAWKILNYRQFVYKIIIMDEKSAFWKPEHQKRNKYL
jgi:hypothetical protein